MSSIVSKPDHKVCNNLGCHFHRLYICDQQLNQIWNITNPDAPAFNGERYILLKLIAEFFEKGQSFLWFNTLPTSLHKKSEVFLVPIPHDFFGVERQLSLTSSLETQPLIESPDLSVTWQPPC